MNRFEMIASRVAVKFDTRKEMQQYRQEHDITPGTKLQLRNKHEKEQRNKDKASSIAERIVIGMRNSERIGR